MSKNTMTYEGKLMAGRPCAGQRRYVASKRTALDGKVWWCIFDHKANKYIEGSKYKMRAECEAGIGWKIHKGLLEIAPSDRDASADKFKKGKHKFVVDVFWTVARSYEVEAKTADEAHDIMQKRVDEGKICVWTDGFEATEDVEVETSGEEKNDGNIEYFG